ncbi:Hsp20/alpha crystallin family protein [Allokutzneria albata]|uniref:Molecular chaperone IbpA, HSP20 family n=1 Tax=Allokutzneria albata TaxID=211114 RepID=A0A1G9SJD0_ALLAB|nr:Hsp20/alpha crystallin family protein [Allokutzneria albata]SDM35596.1 Molecular chaperone IbpA, HSP20 family [Allokutzneria albata]
MTAITRRGTRAVLPELMELFDRSWLFGANAVHVEEYFDDETYVVRAELPGMDAERDIEVTASDGVLTISAKREEEKHDKRHSEFRYGSFARSVQLPAGADFDHVTAAYTNGILDVRVPVKGAGEPQRIPVSTTEH